MLILRNNGSLSYYVVFVIQKLLAEKQAQKEALKQKLNARRMLNEQKEYEMMTARFLMDQANKHKKNLEENVAKEMGKQSSVVSFLFLYFVLNFEMRKGLIFFCEI